MQIPQRRSQKMRDHSVSDDSRFMTKEGLEKLKGTVQWLEKEERPKVVEDLSQALLLGDFSENAEYQAAKAKMSSIDGRLFSLKEKIKHAVVIEDEASPTGAIRLGSTVIVEVNGKQKTYRIVGPQEVNVFKGMISHVSPLGSVLINRKTGDEVAVKTEVGEMRYRVVEVR
jgi:transcription elongation factor GreA